MGKAAWAPPNDNCEIDFISISTFTKKKSCSIQMRFVTRSKKEKKKGKKKRPYICVYNCRRDGVGQLPGCP